MKTKISSLLVAVLCIGILGGCAGGSESQAESSSEASVSESSPASIEPESSEEAASTGDTEARTQLIVGLDDTFAPMGFRDEAGTLVGFDIDLGNAVGEELGLEIKFQPIDWDSKEMELEAKTIDCVWNGMSRTPEREASMTLSQNYLNNKIIIMTTADVNITDKAQLADYQIGTQVKSSALEVIKADEVYESIKDNLFEYASYDDCILDMQAGRIQVMIVDEVLGQYKNNNLDSKFNVATVDFGEDYYVIGFRKDDTELCKQVEDAIKVVKASGKGKEISEKWFGTDLLLEMK